MSVNLRYVTRGAVNVYAALEALSDGSIDPLAGIVPFFEPVLRGINGATYDPYQVAALMRENYGWNLSEDVAEEFIPRLRDKGWLVANGPAANEAIVYTIVLPEEIKEIGQGQALDKFRLISEKFREFSLQLSPLTALPSTVEDFQDILLEWLLYIDAYNEASVDKIHIESYQDDMGKLRQRSIIPNITSLTDDQRYLCARFVEEAIATDPETGHVLCQIAKIGLLTEVVQDFQKPAGPIPNPDLIVYLDAPIALELLGVAGRAAKENTTKLVEELRALGVSLRIFDVSLDEMSGSLRAVLNEANPWGPTAKAIAAGDVLRSFVVEVARDPELFLTEYGVSIHHRTLGSGCIDFCCAA